ncbi:hypothetical protein C8R45DRAFT_943124 [Mycena sanguinolenta]|nr:hypothetical protein C8R45DRAFT_943124 [Mycena sanguinolenta]
MERLAIASRSNIAVCVLTFSNTNLKRASSRAGAIPIEAAKRSPYRSIQEVKGNSRGSEFRGAIQCTRAKSDLTPIQFRTLLSITLSKSRPGAGGFNCEAHEMSDVDVEQEQGMVTIEAGNSVRRGVILGREIQLVRFAAPSGTQGYTFPGFELKTNIVPSEAHWKGYQSAATDQSELGPVKSSGEKEVLGKKDVKIAYGQLLCRQELIGVNPPWGEEEILIRGGGSLNRRVLLGGWAVILQAAAPNEPRLSLRVSQLAHPLTTPPW